MNAWKVYLLVLEMRLLVGLIFLENYAQRPMLCRSSEKKKKKKKDSEIIPKIELWKRAQR